MCRTDLLVEALGKSRNAHGVDGMMPVIATVFLFIDPLHTPRFSYPFRHAPVSGVGISINGFQQKNRMPGNDSGIHQLPSGKSFPAQFLIRDFKSGQFGAPVFEFAPAFEHFDPFLRIPPGGRAELFQTRTQIFPLFLPTGNFDILPDRVVILPFTS